jgi:TIR domain-containing protein
MRVRRIGTRQHSSRGWGICLGDTCGVYDLHSMPPRPSVKTKPTVMISYSHRDAVHMEQIKQGLKKAGFEVLVDQDQFSLSYSTKSEMNRLVDAANVLLVLLSPDSVASKPVQHELKRGFKREQVEHRKIVFAAKVRPVSRVIPAWPEERLWISLYSNFKKSFERLVQNLRRAAESAVPLAQTLPTADELANRTESLLEDEGIRIRGRLLFYSRFGPRLEDDPARRIMALPTSFDQLVGPAFFCTHRGWTLFWHFPRPVLAFRTFSYFSEELMAKSLVSARVGGYMNHRKIRDSWMEELTRIAKRHPRLMDVVVSPHAIAQAHYLRHNLALLKWPRQQPFLVYHQTNDYSPWHSLPTFFGPKTQTMGDLHTVLRLLKAVIRVEIPRLQIPAARWNHMDMRLRKPFRNRKKTQL